MDPNFDSKPPAPRKVWFQSVEWFICFIVLLVNDISFIFLQVKFAPKALPRKVPKIEVKRYLSICLIIVVLCSLILCCFNLFCFCSEVAEEDNATAAADAKELLRRFNVYLISVWFIIGNPLFNFSMIWI